MEMEWWQICELEDDSKSFTEFTVSSIPENWFVRINGVLHCYWPKKNARQKIRSRATPNEGKNWVTYKCRILMDGGNSMKFSFLSDKLIISKPVFYYKNVNQNKFHRREICDIRKR